MARIITMACHKGGVGKTTTAASLGGIFAARGKRVLLVDLDGQKNLTETFTREVFPRSVFEAFAEKRNLPVYEIRENLFVAPSSDDVCRAEAVFGGVTGKDLILHRLLAPLRDQFDWIIVDSPAQLGTMTANALAACDRVLIPLSCDAYSMGGLKQIEELIDAVRDSYRPELDIAGILLTKYNRRRLADRSVGEALKGGYGELFLKSVIRENAALVQAPLCGTDIWNYDRRSNGAADYASLADEIERQAMRWNS